MVKTTVYLDEADKRELANKAQRSGRSEAELIRDGVKQILRGDSERADSLPSWVGMFSAGGDIAKEKHTLRDQWHRSLTAQWQRDSK